MLRIIVLALVACVTARTGFDGIQKLSKSSFTCLKGHGYDFFIGRVWTSTGNYDTTGIANIKYAREAGWTAVDAYIFPCLKSTCAPAANQVEATINKLKADGATVNYVYLDIEVYAWHSNQETNRKFIEDMVNEVKKMGHKPAIYSNNYNWESIVGLSWKPYGDLPLWWANYNGEPGFEKFVPFGGWTKPHIHQYKGTTAGPCSVSMDLNYAA